MDERSSNDVGVSWSYGLLRTGPERRIHDVAAKTRRKKKRDSQVAGNFLATGFVQGRRPERLVAMVGGQTGASGIREIEVRGE